MIVAECENLHKYKIRIEGMSRTGENTTRQISVLASSIEELYAYIREALRNAHKEGG